MHPSTLDCWQWLDYLGHWDVGMLLLASRVKKIGQPAHGQSCTAACPSKHLWTSKISHLLFTQQQILTPGERMPNLNLCKHRGMD